MLPHQAHLFAVFVATAGNRSPSPLRNRAYPVKVPNRSTGKSWRFRNLCERPDHGFTIKSSALRKDPSRCLPLKVPIPEYDIPSYEPWIAWILWPCDSVRSGCIKLYQLVEPNGGVLDSRLMDVVPEDRRFRKLMHGTEGGGCRHPFPPSRLRYETESSRYEQHPQPAVNLQPRSDIKRKDRTSVIDFTVSPRSQNIRLFSTAKWQADCLGRRGRSLWPLPPLKSAALPSSLPCRLCS